MVEEQVLSIGKGFLRANELWESMKMLENESINSASFSQRLLTVIVSILNRFIF